MRSEAGEGRPHPLREAQLQQLEAPHLQRWKSLTPLDDEPSHGRDLVPLVYR